MVPVYAVPDAEEVGEGERGDVGWRPAVSHLPGCALNVAHSGGCFVPVSGLDGDISTPTRREQRTAFLEASRPKLVGYLR